MSLTADAALQELLARLGAAPGRAVVLSGEELQQWPSDAVAALQVHAVLRAGQPGNTAVCPGCERACEMPVEQRLRSGRPAAAFIVCDRRDDIGCVPLAQSYLERWRADDQTLGDALAALLGHGASQSASADPDRLRLGVVAGRTGKVPVHLRFDDRGGAVLQVAGHSVELATVLTIQACRLVLDTRYLGRCADAPAGGATLAAETPEQRAERLGSRKKALQQQGVRAFLQAIAQEEGISESMVKKILGRSAQSAQAAMPAWAAPLAPTKGDQTGRKRKP